MGDVTLLLSPVNNGSGVEIGRIRDRRSVPTNRSIAGRDTGVSRELYSTDYSRLATRASPVSAST